MTLPRLLLILVLTAACGKDGDPDNGGIPPAPSKVGATDTLLVNGLYNSGFEWIADSTTDPPKYGAYWVGAFKYEEGNPQDLIEEDVPFKGERFLRLRPDSGEVLQKVVADLRWTDRIEIILAIRLHGGASLEVTLEDGPGRTVTAVFKAREGGSGAGLTTRWQGESTGAGNIRLKEAQGDAGSAWTLVRIPLGSRFREEHGILPIPRLNVRLLCKGPAGGSADVDEVYAPVAWPHVTAAGLERRIIEKVTACLETWFLPPEQGGLGLVDPETGYLRVVRFNVETEKDRIPASSGGLHTLHELLLRWLRFVREREWKEEIDRWIPHLERFVRTLLDRNFDPNTRLPRTVVLPSKEPRDQVPVTVGSYIDFLLEAREVIMDQDLKERCLEQARAAADTLLTLQKAHDLPEENAPNTIRYNPGKGRFEGEWPNWFGHIPNSLTPTGVIEPPARFNTSWAILTGRTFWYHVFKSASAVMNVHARRPREGDLPAVRKVLSLYHRDWDAARYDLENDTDDHYGYLCEDLVPLLENSEGRLQEALRLVQAATDHRLAREAKRPDDTLWIQAVRLGTACAGDSPRAFKGLLDFYELPPAVNPTSSGNRLYREALLELAANDLKGRQLTNGQFTESFFKNWEMVCICFRGSYQGDCREQPPGYWHGDVGDVFGGPPTSAVKAQTFAYRAAATGERQHILAALGVIEHATESTMARRHGYIYGLNPAVARQYGLLEKYIRGESLNNAAGVAYAVTWAKLLPHLDTKPAPAEPRISILDPGPWTTGPEGIEVRCEVHGPSGGLVALPLYEGQAPPFPAPLSHQDRRMAAFPLEKGWMNDPLRLDGEGSGIRTFTIHEGRHALIQPILLDPAGGAPLDLGPPCVLKESGRMP